MLNCFKTTYLHISSGYSCKAPAFHNMCVCVCMFDANIARACTRGKIEENERNVQSEMERCICSGIARVFGSLSMK